MTECEVIDLTPSDSGSDSDFIQAACHFCTYCICFCNKFLYIKFLLQRKLFYRTRACSQADSFALREAESFASRC